MSLNDINLSPALLVHLYATVLVEDDAMSMPEPMPIEFLGKNEKGILIVVANADVPFLTDAELSFLTSVLAACKYNLADVAIVNFLKNKKGSAEWTTELKINTVLLFGVSPIDFGLPIHFPHYQVQEFAKRTYIALPPLAQIEKDKEEKKNLWASLKKHFGL